MCRPYPSLTTLPPVEDELRSAPASLLADPEDACFDQETQRNAEDDEEKEHHNDRMDADGSSHELNHSSKN